MNRKTIKNTAIARWSNEDDCFIVSSPLIDSVIGAGDSEMEAWKEFCNILDDAYEAYLEGALKYDNPGRPAKNRIALNVDVQVRTKNTIKTLAKEKGCSQGEVVDYLLACHLFSGQYKDENPDTKFLIKDSQNPVNYASQKSALKLETRLKTLETKIDRVLKSLEPSKFTRKK